MQWGEDFFGIGFGFSALWLRPQPMSTRTWWLSLRMACPVVSEALLGCQGTIAVRLVIHEDGSVGEAKRESSTLKDAAMVGCVVDAFKAIAFPVSSGGEATVIYPLQFGQSQ